MSMFSLIDPVGAEPVEHLDARIDALAWVLVEEGDLLIEIGARLRVHVEPDERLGRPGGIVVHPPAEVLP